MFVAVAVTTLESVLMTASHHVLSQQQVLTRSCSCMRHYIPIWCGPRERSLTGFHRSGVQKPQQTTTT